MIEQYFPCEIVCAEDIDVDWFRASCRHGLFAVTTGAGSSANHTKAFCRFSQCMRLLDDYSAGLVKFTEDEKKQLRQRKLISY